MSPAPDCSYQSILSFNNWCRRPGWWEVQVWADGPRPHPGHPRADIWGHHRGQTDGWPRGAELIGAKLKKCLSFEGCPWTESKHSRCAGPLHCHCSGRWLLDGELLSGMKCAAAAGTSGQIETYFTPSLASLLRCCAARPDPAETNCNSSHSIGHSTATEANTNLYLVWQMHFDCFCEDLNTWTRASTLKCYCFTIQ